MKFSIEPRGSVGIVITAETETDRDDLLGRLERAFPRDYDEVKAEFEAALAAVQDAPRPPDADDPVAIRYGEASAALNHLNRRKEFALL